MKTYITQEEIDGDIKARTISSVAKKTKNINFRDVIIESILTGDIEAHGIVAQAINPNFKDFETAYDRLIRNKRKKETAGICVKQING